MICPANNNPKEARVAKVVSEKDNFRSRNNTRDTKKFFIKMIK